MRILILGLNYLPESTSIGPYTADLAEHLLMLGHKVRVVTGFPMAPQWRIWDGYRGSWFRREIINSVPVLRTYLYVPERPRTTIARILFDMSFTISSFLGGLISGPCDLIIVISPPLQLGLTGWLLGVLKRAPLFFHIQDLVPDAAIATGMMQEGSKAVKVARFLERFIYRRARSIGVISGGFIQNLRSKNVPSAKIALLPNYIDLSYFQTSAPFNGFRQKHKIGPEKFVVMYSGSIALKQGLQVFVQAAAQLQAYTDIVLYIIGEGPYLEELQQSARQLELRNIQFLPLQPRDGLPQQLAAADVLVITQKQSVTDVVFPGKLLYYMAAARPILAAVSAESETGRFIHEHNIGVVVTPEHPAALAAAILRLRHLLHTEQTPLNQLGHNGRKTVEAYFDRRVVLQKFAQHIETLVQTNKGDVLSTDMKTNAPL